jgi:hypothetical protein
MKTFLKIRNFASSPSFVILNLCCPLLTKYHSGDEIKNTEMDRACSTYGVEEGCIQGFSGET